MSNHVIGPWKKSTYSNTCVIADTGGDYVEVVADCDNPHLTEEQVEANIRLIAMAPEILEFIRSLSPEDLRNEKTFVRCKSLIAKVEGR
jgi:hypothetical protein